MTRILGLVLPFSIIAVPIFLSVTAHAAPVPWALDKAHTRVGFSVRHLAITNVHGQFHDFDAVLTAEPDSGKLTSVQATATTTSVDTGIKARDEHLRGDDLFNAERFPTLRLESRSIRWDKDRFTAEVDVTLRDVTRRVLFTGELVGVRKVDFGQGPELRAGYEASATINRQDFGLRFNRVAEGTAVVGYEVILVLAIQMSRRL